MAKGQREVAAGLQISASIAQITWYTTSEKEPVTCGPGNGEQPELVPLPETVSGLLFGEKNALEDTSMAVQHVADFLSQMLSMIPSHPTMAAIRLMVTLPQLTPYAQELIPEAACSLGIERKNVYLQDFLSSFYYYTVNQKKELWSSDVALLEYMDNSMVGYVLHIDHSKKPALVTVKEAARMEVDESLREGRTAQQWDQERDRLLFELLKKVFERRNVGTSFLVGDYYDGNWASRSFQYLCHHRHAFRGANLYTKGACYAAMSRSGMNRMPELLFLGADMIRENLGIMMRVHGKETFYTLVSAGINWYEAHHECEFIPDQETTIPLVTKPMDGGEEVIHLLRLKHFPNRPNRATRLRMSVYFTSADCCVVEVEDRGFGGFYPSEGRTWKRTIRFY